MKSNKLQQIKKNVQLRTKSNHKKIADIFNDYFVNVVTSLEIPEFDTTGQLSENISQPTLKAIVKYRKHLVLQQ